MGLESTSPFLSSRAPIWNQWKEPRGLKWQIWVWFPSFPTLPEIFSKSLVWLLHNLTKAIWEGSGRTANQATLFGQHRHKTAPPLPLCGYQAVSPASHSWVKASFLCFQAGAGLHFTSIHLWADQEVRKRENSKSEHILVCPCMISVACFLWKGNWCGVICWLSS